MMSTRWHGSAKTNAKTKLSDPLPLPGRRIAIIGTSGSGKTTLAQTLSARLDIPHVELDALHWGPDWTPTATEPLREKVAAALSGEAWVVDGNYSKLRDLIWPRAETLIWLDYALPFVMGRLTRRTFGRMLRREALWAGNRERLHHLFTKDSILLWALQTHPKHRRQYPTLLADPAYAHVATIRFRTPRETARWLAELPQ